VLYFGAMVVTVAVSRRLGKQYLTSRLAADAR
jgi:hypothetical protein